MDLDLEWYEWLGVTSAILSAIVLVRLSWWRQRFRALDRLLHRLLDRHDRQHAFRSAWSQSLEEINTTLDGRSALYGVSFEGPPSLTRQSLSDCEVLAAHEAVPITERAAVIRSRPNLNNRPHGFADTRDVRVGGSAIRFMASDYATVLAAREAGLRPPALSGNAIVFCQASGEILLQLRGATATYANCLHIFGGNYEPAMDVAQHDDAPPGPPLKNTMLREVYEECGLRITEGGNPIVFLGEELTTGFVRATFAGVSVSAADRSKVTAPPEGQVAWLSFADLARYAATGRCFGRSWRFVPSGAMDLLMWLRLGAPDQYRETPHRAAALEAYKAFLANADARIAKSPT